MEFNFQNYGNYWSLVESIIAVPTFILTLYIFFSDPLRRWNFFGYRPTVLLIIHDPDIKRVLLVKDHGVWGFPQGGIYTSDISDAVKMVLEREVGLSIRDIDLRYWRPLGTIKVGDRYRNKRSSFGSISIRREYVGKGYVAFFVTTNFKKIKKRINLGFAITDYKFLGLNEASKLIEKQGQSLSSLGNRKIVLESLAELTYYLSEKDYSEKSYI